MSLAMLLLFGLALSPQEPPAAGVPAPPPATTEPSARTPGTDEERLAKVRERRTALEKELARLRGEEKSLLGEVEQLELELRLRTEELTEIQITLRRTRARLDATVARVRQLETSLAAARPALAAHARALYKLGDMSYLRLLLSIDRPSDFFRGYRFITTLARRDNARVASFRADLAALTTEKAELEQRTQESIELRARLTAARRSLDAQRGRKTDLLTSLVERKELNAAYVEELAQAETRLQELLSGSGSGEVAVPLGAFRGSLPWPVDGRLRAGFGRRKHPKFDTYTVHNGLEIEAPPEAEVRAVHEGRVVFAERFRGYGLMVVVDHGAKHHSLYAHLAEVAVEPGQEVAAGTTLGRADPGGEDGPGVYFEMRYQGRPEDPLDWLRRP
ncbi:MAG TPA: peptidoglycan DD-metalloendopeptidase family protein [Vicinamibacteria bacterium]|nr:peptidoglycan DD-metalloendopeptidase family protein [Vicinamibacteria bacterium]